MTVSYNQDLSIAFSEQVRNGIDTDKGDGLEITFRDIFPNVRIKHGDASKGKWSLEGSFRSYFATSFTGGATGMGCQIGIIDDPVKTIERH